MLKHSYKKILNLLTILLVLLLCTGCGNESEQRTSEAADDQSTIRSVDDLALSTEDGSTYTFTYQGETYQAIHRKDNWKIRNSYRITNSADMVIICRALSDIHPIPNSEGTGNRTPEDLAFEWEQHNLAYTLLPEGHKWKKNARDVDLNPEDQGKTILDFALERSGH